MNNKIQVLVVLLFCANSFGAVLYGQEAHAYSFSFVNEGSDARNTVVRIHQASATYVDRQGEIHTEILPMKRFDCSKGKCELSFSFKLIELTFDLVHPNGEDETKNVCYKELKNSQVLVEVKRSGGMQGLTKALSQCPVPTIYCCQTLPVLCCPSVCCQPIYCQQVYIQPSVCATNVTTATSNLLTKSSKLGVSSRQPSNPSKSTYVKLKN